MLFHSCSSALWVLLSSALFSSFCMHFLFVLSLFNFFSILQSDGSTTPNTTTSTATATSSSSPICKCGAKLDSLALRETELKMRESALADRERSIMERERYAKRMRIHFFLLFAKSVCQHAVRLCACVCTCVCDSVRQQPQPEIRVVNDFFLLFLLFFFFLSNSPQGN